MAIIQWGVGVMVSDITKSRMSESAKLRCTDEWRAENIERLRIKIDDTKLIKSYNSGMTQAECAMALGVSRKVVFNALKRLGVKSRKAAKRDQIGDRNTGWKGEDANLVNKHRRLYRAFGQPSKCDICGTTDESKSYDWANLTGDYDNPTDFKRMCRSCHSKYDKKHLNFKGAKGGKGKRGTRDLP